MKNVLFVFSVVILLTVCVELGFSSSITKTVGVGQNYTTIGDAFADINTNGLADTVNLALMDTVYTESPLMYNPLTPQPTVLNMYQAGPAKPHVQINAGGLPFGMLINNRADFVLYNVKIEPSVTTTWLAGVSVRSMEENSRVYIQSGGVTGSTTQRGYDVLADSSSGVYVFGCLVINVQTIGIYIELQEFPPLASKPAGRNQFSSGVGNIRVDSNTISGPSVGIEIKKGIASSAKYFNPDWLYNIITGADTGIVITGVSAQRMNLSNNTFTNCGMAMSLRDCSADSLLINDNTGTMSASSTTSRYIELLIVNDPGTAKQLRPDFSVLLGGGNSFDCGSGNQDLTLFYASLALINVNLSHNIFSTLNGAIGIHIDGMQGTGTQFTSTDNRISGFNIGTQLDSLGNGAEIHFSGGIDTVSSKAIYLPNGHNVSVFELGSSVLASSPQMTRYRVVSLEKFGTAKGLNTISSPTNQTAIDVTFNNDPGFTTEVSISHADIDWTQKGISIEGDFGGTASIEDVNIQLNENLLDENEIGVKVANRRSDITGTFDTEMLQLRVSGNKGVVMDSLNGGTHQMAEFDITAGTTGIEMNEAPISDRRLFIFLRESIDMQSSPSRTRYRVVSLEKLASSLNNYASSTAIKLNLNADSCEVAIEDGDIDWIGNGIIIDAPPSVIYTVKNMDINLNNSGGYTAMQYRSKRSELPPNLDGVKTAELNHISNAGTAMYFEFQPSPMGIPLNGSIVKDNTITNCGVGIDVLQDNDTTGGFSMEGLTFPPMELRTNTIGILAAVAIPNFVAMQLRSKRSELPTNVSDIKLENNQINGGGVGMVGIDFQFYPMGSVEIDSNEISGCRYNLLLGQLSTRDYIGNDDWIGRPLSITNNTFEGGGLDLDVVGHALTLQGNSFTCTSGSGLSNSSMAGNRYELQVRGSNRVRLASNSVRPDFSVLLSGNTFCDGDLIVDIANDDTTITDMNTTITNNQSNGNVTITTYNTENEISGNTFNNTTAMSSSSMAIKKYELAVRRCTCPDRPLTSSGLNAGAPVLLNFNNNTLGGFNDVSISIDDSAGTGNVNVDSNTVSTGTVAASSSMATNRYELQFRRSSRFNYASSSSIGGGTSFSYTNNSVTGYSNVSFDLDDSTETLSASLTGNTFTNSGSASTSSSMAGNQYELQYRRGGRASFALNSSNFSASSFEYSGNNVSGYSGINIDVNDEAGEITGDFTGNTFNGTSGSLSSSSSMATNRYELQFRRSSRFNLANAKPSANDEGSISSLTGSEWFTYNNNTVSGFSGGAFDLENNGDAGIALLEGNTISGGTFSATSKPQEQVMMPVGKYELNVRRSNRASFASLSSVTPGDSLIVRNNTFTGLDGGGLDINTENNSAGDTMNVWIDGNTLSSVSSPFRFNLYESESDSGYTKFLQTANVINGGTEGSNVIDARYNLLLGAWVASSSAKQQPHISTSPNTFSNGGGLLFTGSPIDTIQLNFQNIFGNTMNIVNATNSVVDARYCWWGTTNRAEIAAKMQGNVLFEPFLTDSVSSTIGSISGTVYLDADASYSMDSFEMKLQGQEVTLWQNATQIAADTTDANGNYSFSDLALGVYQLQLTMPNGYVGTENDHGVTVDFISGGIVTENFGIYQELQRFRTFKADTALSKKPVKMTFKGDLLKSAYPNTSSALENVFARLGKNGATFLGVPQTDKNRAKQFAWIVYKKAADLGKLYTSPHTGTSYPIDSLRPAGKKAKFLKGPLKADRKTYNNVAWEQGIAFNLNLVASALGVTPQGFGELVVDTSITLGGEDLQGWTLAEVGSWLNELMTYWDSLGVDNSTAYAGLGDFSTVFLKRLNDGFSATVTDLNSAIDTAGVKAGDVNIAGHKKNPYAVTLNGVATASGVGLVEYVPGIAPKVVIQDAGFLEDEELLPTTTVLNQNYPNPFNPGTELSFVISQPSLVTLKVYDMLGREVATLLNAQEIEEGSHAISFDASSLSSGMYFYRLTASNIGDGSVSFTDMKKMLLVK